MGAKRERSFLIQDVVQETPDVRSYRCHPGTGLDFLPGQFSRVWLAGHPDRVACLTYSTAPEDECFELTLKRSGGFGTAFYDAAGEGDVVVAQAPAGSFALHPEQRSEPLCFLGRDYCITAARSFARHLAGHPGGCQLLVLHELSEQSQALFANEFEILSRAGVGFSYRQIFGALDAEQLLDAPQVGDRTLFFAQAEAADARRYRDMFATLGVARERIQIERWS